MSLDKIQTISDWPEPHKVKDIQSFLGFANFYHRFIFNYFDIVVPLTWLTRKDAPWIFSEDCQCAFNALKHTFTTMPILTHFIPDTPIIVEMDTSDYAIAGILSITCSDGEIHLVVVYSQTLTALELNYDTHDKELLAIFEAFQNWCHYLEGSTSPIDIVTDHKNLEYFSTSKVLSCRQAQWSKFLSQFNLVIHFHPGKLGAKLDTLTRRWDVYPKEGDSGYARVNPQNLRPVFTHEQLTNSLCTTILEFLVLRRAVAIMDVETLHNNILSALPSDPIAQIHLSDPPDSCWSTDEAGFLHLDGCIYVPDLDGLCLQVLWYHHDHPLSGHFGQNRTLELIWCKYTWPGLRTFVKDYIWSCTSCTQAKTLCHQPYGLLKQLPVLERPWNSISMDFIEQLPASTRFTAILVVVDRPSSYHLEGNGQTEQSNQTLKQYLHIYCNYQQDNWADLLPLAEFAYNNAPSTTTGVSPFFTNKGYHPNISIYPECDMTSAWAHDYAVNLKSLHQYL